jgi:hypothetical protein
MTKLIKSWSVDNFFTRARIAHRGPGGDSASKVTLRSILAYVI